MLFNLKLLFTTRTLVTLAKFAATIGVVKVFLSFISAIVLYFVHVVIGQQHRANVFGLTPFSGQSQF